VEVVDNGVGENLTRLSPSRLTDRAEALNGRLGVESPLGTGTRVWAEVPIG
jgi:signal transduction histidine kinase